MIVHIGHLPPEQWAEIEDGEASPFGESAHDFRWRAKDLHTVLIDGGRAIAAVGLTLALVEVGGETFDVVGIGGVIVTHSRRGEGHLRPTLEAALERAATLGPERALLFCSLVNAPLYARFGFVEIAAPVVAAGQEMPPAAMWRPLRDGETWPEGPVSLPQLPF